MLGYNGWHAKQQLAMLASCSSATEPTHITVQLEEQSDGQELFNSIPEASETNPPAI